MRLMNQPKRELLEKNKYKLEIYNKFNNQKIYNNLFEVTKVYDNDMFETLYNETICKDILIYSEFVEIFEDTAPAL